MERIRCEVRIGVALGIDWTAWFDALRVAANPDGTTTIAGDLPDQAALHGLLTRIRDLGLPLLSLEVVASPAAAERPVE